MEWCWGGETFDLVSTLWMVVLSLPVEWHQNFLLILTLLLS